MVKFDGNGIGDEHAFGDELNKNSPNEVQEINLSMTIATAAVPTCIADYPSTGSKSTGLKRPLLQIR